MPNRFQHRIDELADNVVIIPSEGQQTQERVEIGVASSVGRPSLSARDVSGLTGLSRGPRLGVGALASGRALPEHSVT